MLMFDAFTRNDLLLSMMSTLAGDDVDLESARKAFEVTRGDSRAKFIAAVQARLAQLASPEVFIDLPEFSDSRWLSTGNGAVCRWPPHQSPECSWVVRSATVAPTRATSVSNSVLGVDVK